MRELERPSLPISIIELESQHSNPQNTCSVCGTPTINDYEPREFWGKRIIIRTEKMPVYRCPHPECGVATTDLDGIIEFTSKAIPIADLAKDRSMGLRESLRAAKQTIKLREAAEKTNATSKSK